MRTFELTYHDFPVRIRRFQRKDAARVSYLIRKTLLEVNSKDYPRKVIDFMYNRFTPNHLIETSKRRDMYVVVRKGELLATGSLSGNTIMTVFVNPRFQGKGIGTKIMNHLEGMAKKRNYKTVRIPSSITAYGFYRKLGYRKVEVVVDKNYGKTIIMRKELHARAHAIS